MVERAHAEGLSVVAWGVDDAATVDTLRAAGVDGVTADSWTLAGPAADAEDDATVAD